MNPPLRDRLWSFKAMLLVALATLIIGGFTGAGITALASSDDDGPHRGQVRVGQLPPGAPYGPPGQGRRPWQNRHFYWNDGPRPTDPNLRREQQQLKELDKRLDKLEKKQAKPPTN